MLDSAAFCQFRDPLVAEWCTVVGLNLLGTAVLTDDVVLDECGDTVGILIRHGLSDRPFGEIVHSDQKIAISASRSWQRTNEVHPPPFKGAIHRDGVHFMCRTGCFCPLTCIARLDIGTNVSVHTRPPEAFAKLGGGSTDFEVSAVQTVMTVGKDEGNFRRTKYAKGTFRSLLVQLPETRGVRRRFTRRWVFVSGLIPKGDRGFGKEIVVEVRRKSVLTEVSRNRVTRKGIRRVAFALPVFYVEGVILKLSDLAGPRTLLIKVPAAVGYPSYGMNAECRRNFVGNAMLSSGEVTGNPG